MGCNTRGCNYDGGDCALTEKKQRSMLVGAVALVLTVDPDLFVNQSNNFLMALGKVNVFFLILAQVQHLSFRIH